MWTVIYVAYNEADMQRVVKILRNEGFLVKEKQVSAKDGIYEISVPNSEAEEAHQMLIYM